MGVSARFVEKAAPTCMSTWQGDDLHAISGAKTVGNREDCSPLKQNLACSSAISDEQRVSSSLPSAAIITRFQQDAHYLKVLIIGKPNWRQAAKESKFIKAL